SPAWRRGSRFCGPAVPHPPKAPADFARSPNCLKFLAMASTPDVTVRKFFYDGTPSYVWEGRLIERKGDLVVLEAYFTRDRRDLGYVVFERGDLFIEFYYLDRWYNVLQIYSAQGDPKGWYCNITKPATLREGELRFVDLAIDLFA